jgi:pathogenesis-related protein 1
MARATAARALLVLLACATAPACRLSNPHGKAASDSYFDDNPDRPTVGDIPPAGMEIVLESHNRKRKRHCAKALQWSAELAEVAQGWADALKKRGCPLDHNKTKYGENLAAGTASVMTGERAVDIWYEERDHYKYGPNEGSSATGHFTQVVWRDSRLLGCGTATCEGKRLWVCNYDPPGNVKGEYQDEVKPTTCR